MKIKIRNIEKKHNQFVEEIIKSVFEEFNITHYPGSVYHDPTTSNLFELFDNTTSEYFVAFDEEKIVGSCGYYFTPGLPDSCAELVKFYIKKEYRGRGIGALLLNKTIEAAKKAGIRQLYLESFPELSAAVSLYEKVGFEHLTQPMGNSGHFSCSIWMIKKL